MTDTNKEETFESYVDNLAMTHIGVKENLKQLHDTSIKEKDAEIEKLRETIESAIKIHNNHKSFRVKRK